MLLDTEVDHPPMTLRGESVESFDGRWAVALVKSREEKACAEHLSVLGVPYFLPLKLARDRFNRRVWTALFPSYIFFCETDGESRYSVLDSGYCLSSDSAKSILSCAMQRQLKDDLIRIHQQQLERPEIITKYTPGTPIRVVRGVWMGREGFVERDSGKPMIIFRSSIFGDCSTPFEVDRGDVEVCE